MNSATALPWVCMPGWKFSGTRAELVKQLERVSQEARDAKNVVFDAQKLVEQADRERRQAEAALADLKRNQRNQRSRMSDAELFALGALVYAEQREPTEARTRLEEELRGRGVVK